MGRESRAYIDPETRMIYEEVYGDLYHQLVHEGGWGLRDFARFVKLVEGSALVNHRRAEVEMIDMYDQLDNGPED